jgi:histidinol-phosphate aminotransferase
MKPIHALIRPHLRNLQPYSSARDEFSGTAHVWLDANENPFETGLNRYPDPYQRELKVKIGALKEAKPEQIFLGNGSDEAIDLLIRAFVEPGKEEVLICPPGYGMYTVSANIHGAAIREVPLDEYFQPDVGNIRQAVTKESKLLFLCSPNNPTGNVMEWGRLEEILSFFPGLVVLDEAYVDFCPEGSFLPKRKDYENLVILQTMSKAWGLAGIRLGMAFAQEEVIAVLNKIKPPYNLNILTQQRALQVLEKPGKVKQEIAEIVKERGRLADELKGLEGVLKVYPSAANFLLVEMKKPREVYQNLLEQGIVVRDRTKHVKDCLRITVGTEKENNELLRIMAEIYA